jgi:hypothetical protein
MAYFFNQGIDFREIESDCVPSPFGAKSGRRPVRFPHSSGLGDLDDVRTYGYKAERAAALIYAHFKKEFGGS